MLTLRNQAARLTHGDLLTNRDVIQRRYFREDESAFQSPERLQLDEFVDDGAVGHLVLELSRIEYEIPRLVIRAGGELRTHAGCFSSDCECGPGSHDTYDIANASHSGAGGLNRSRCHQAERDLLILLEKPRVAVRGDDREVKGGQRVCTKSTHAFGKQ